MKNRFPPRLKSRLWPLLLCFIMVNVITSVKSEFSEYALSNVMFLAVGYTFVALGMIFLSKNDFENYLPKTLVISMSISSFWPFLAPCFTYRRLSLPVWKILNCVRQEARSMPIICP